MPANQKAFAMYTHHLEVKTIGGGISRNKGSFSVMFACIALLGVLYFSIKKNLHD